MREVVIFNKSGYDPFIDFIKAFAIICVLIGHTFPFPEYWAYGLWVGMQVPLFVLVQSFHSFKKDNPRFLISKSLKRVIVPFLLIQVVLFVFLFVKGGSNGVVGIFNTFGVSGGFGPGSYYPWVYLQIAILLPVVKKWMDKGSKLQNVLVFMLICESLEVVSALIDLPDSIHRLLAIRYLFLLYFAWIWVKEGIIISPRTILFSSLTLIVAIYFYYLSVDDEPFFYQTAWKCHRWPCYYYVAMGGTILLKKIHTKISKNKFVDNSIKFLSKNSYEIFLIQMAVLVVIPSVSSIGKILNVYGISTPDYVLGLLMFLRITIVFGVSIWGGYLFNIVYSKFNTKIGK